MRRFVPFALVLALVAAVVAVGSAGATSSPVNLTVQDTGTDATGPFVTLKWAPAPSNVNHIDLYRSDHTVRWDSLPRTQVTFTNRDQVVVGTTYGWSLYACSGTAECKTSTASDTVASDTVTVKAGQPACSDLADNDLDGRIDQADPTCPSATWDDEANAPTPTPTPTPTPSPTPTPTPTPPPQTCSFTATPGQSFSSAISGLGSGTVLCLPAGTYNWGDYVIPAGKTITGSTDAGVATVVGEAVINNTGVTLSNLKLVAASNETHAVVDGKASNATIQNVEVDTNHQPGVQGMIVGGSSSPAPSNFKVLDTVIHGARGGGPNNLTDSEVHGIYWQNGSGSGNEIGRTWVYDVSGYGFHFYSVNSPATNVLIHNTVVDDSIVRGVLFDGPTGNTYRDSVVTDSPYGVVCRIPGNTLINVRSGAGFQSCTGTGLVTADTVFDNEAARNYGNDTSGHFVTGPLY
jgi:hypothetical protein